MGDRGCSEPPGQSAARLLPQTPPSSFTLPSPACRRETEAGPYSATPSTEPDSQSLPFIELQVEMRRFRGARPPTLSLPTLSHSSSQRQGVGMGGLGGLGLCMGAGP